MATILESITDTGLRRLYKFILKRALGPFLTEDISLDQIDLKRRDGSITLTDLTLQCDSFNDLLDLPLRLRSVKVDFKPSTIILHSTLL